MSKFTMLFLVLFALAGGIARAETPPDAKGSNDHPSFSRFPGCYIRGYDESAFDAQKFRVTEKKSYKDVVVEGRKYMINYACPRDIKVSPLQMLRNYTNAVTKAGGEILYEKGNAATFRFKKGGKEIWASVDTQGLLVTGVVPNFKLSIVEKSEMEQVLTANAMANDLQTNGKVAIYGILFDTGKSEIKSESEPVLAEIGKLMESNSGLKLYVVGHTDMVGDAAANLKLSEARAKAVVAELVSKYRVASGRLAAKGVGPFAPVATNVNEEGRAGNRRVELVSMAVK
jgi:outer membrane protein OmpA-like peptidoglycan-associated protein